MKVTSSSTPEQTENTVSAERQKTSFPEESVQNANLYKPVLNKIMTTHTCEIPFRISFKLKVPEKKIQNYCFHVITHSTISLVL